MSTSLVVCAAPRHDHSHKRFFQIVVSDTAAAPVESPAGLIHASSLDLPTRVAQKHTHEVIHCKSCCMHSASHQLVRLSTVTQSLSHVLALSALSQYAPSAVDIPIVIASCNALRPLCWPSYQALKSEAFHVHKRPPDLISLIDVTNSWIHTSMAHRWPVPDPQARHKSKHASLTDLPIKCSSIIYDMDAILLAIRRLVIGGSGSSSSNP